MISTSKKIFLAGLFSAPIFLFYLRHFLVFISNPDAFPTGFVQGDQAYYLANARQIFDEGFTFFYSNPFSPFEGPSIYFQPQLFFLGSIIHFTGFNPGYVFVVFGLVMVFLAFYVLIKLYEKLFGIHSWLDFCGLAMVSWGGGVIDLAGFIHQLYLGSGLIESIRNFAEFDPFGGGWLLNFLKSLVYPMEAYYHLLVVTIAYFTISKRHVPMIVLVGILSISHPFTGLEFVCIQLTYAVFERLIGQNLSVKPVHILSLFAILVFHISYYILFLDQFPDHRILKDQWEIAWVLPGITLIFNFIIFLPIILSQIASKTRFHQFFSSFSNRYFFVIFGIVFLLSNHDLFTPFLGIRAVQPIHFARGYDVFALSILGVPIIISFIRNIKNTGMKKMAMVVAMVISFSDNILFFTDMIYSEPWRSNHYAKREELYIFDFLNTIKFEGDKPIIISEDQRLGYWVTVYTPYRTWFSHYYNTPYNLSRLKEILAFFEKGEILNSAWRSISSLIIFSKNSPNSQMEMGIKNLSKSGKMELVYQNKLYLIYKYQPNVLHN